MKAVAVSCLGVGTVGVRLRPPTKSEDTGSTVESTDVSPVLGKRALPSVELTSTKRQVKSGDTEPGAQTAPMRVLKLTGSQAETQEITAVQTLVGVARGRMETAENKNHEAPYFEHDGNVLRWGFLDSAAIENSHEGSIDKVEANLCLCSPSSADGRADDLNGCIPLQNIETMVRDVLYLLKPKTGLFELTPVTHDFGYVCTDYRAHKVRDQVQKYTKDFSVNEAHDGALQVVGAEGIGPIKIRLLASTSRTFKRLVLKPAQKLLRLRVSDDDAPGFPQLKRRNERPPPAAPLLKRQNTGEDVSDDAPDSRPDVPQLKRSSSVLSTDSVLPGQPPLKRGNTGEELLRREEEAERVENFRYRIKTEAGLYVDTWGKNGVYRRDEKWGDTSPTELVVAHGGLKLLEYVDAEKCNELYAETAVDGEMMMKKNDGLDCKGAARDGVITRYADLCAKQAVTGANGFVDKYKELHQNKDTKALPCFYDATGVPKDAEDVKKLNLAVFEGHTHQALLFKGRIKEARKIAQRILTDKDSLEEPGPDISAIPERDRPVERAGGDNWDSAYAKKEKNGLENAAHPQNAKRMGKVRNMDVIWDWAHASGIDEEEQKARMKKAKNELPTFAFFLFQYNMPVAPAETATVLSRIVSRIPLTHSSVVRCVAGLGQKSPPVIESKGTKYDIFTQCAEYAFDGHITRWRPFGEFDKPGLLRDVYRILPKRVVREEDSHWPWLNLWDLNSMRTRDQVESFWWRWWRWRTSHGEVRNTPSGKEISPHVKWTLLPFHPIEDWDKTAPVGDGSSRLKSSQYPVLPWSRTFGMYTYYSGTHSGWYMARTNETSADYMLSHDVSDAVRQDNYNPGMTNCNNFANAFMEGVLRRDCLDHQGRVEDGLLEHLFGEVCVERWPVVKQAVSALSGAAKYWA